MDPATGSQIALCSAASPSDVSRAITQVLSSFPTSSTRALTSPPRAHSVAQETFDSGIWSRMAPADRASVMSSIARLLATRVAELAVLESLQTGRPLREMRTQLGRLAPLTVLELARITKEAGLPDGVLSVLPGFGAITGKALVEDPRIKKVDLTGGTAGGRVVAGIAGSNLASVTAELGGKAPILIFANVNLALAVNGVAFASFIASGQTCVAGTRILIQRPILEEFTALLREKANGIERRIGSPFNEGSMMGPVISAKQLAIVEELVEAAQKDGVEVICGGKRMQGKSSLDGHDLSGGFFYPPTILVDGPSTKITSTRIWKEEAFGPVIVLVPFDTEEEAGYSRFQEKSNRRLPAFAGDPPGQ
ncbi:hypothetical protein P7C70_g4916, partial [Phenoliferia sp. Uapishka_3]